METTNNKLPFSVNTSEDMPSFAKASEDKQIPNKFQLPKYQNLFHFNGISNSNTQITTEID